VRALRTEEQKPRSFPADAVPELPAQSPPSKPGDLWLLVGMALCVGMPSIRPTS
jgi:hypothetical protein